MDANTHIEKIIDSISSLDTSLLNLQYHIDQLNDTSNAFNTVTTQHGAGTQYDIEKKFEVLQSNITEKSTNVENLISNVLDPERMQLKINNLKNIQSRIDYWKNKGASS
jgi:hypothetical protein